MQALPSSFRGLLVNFSFAFTSPSFENFAGVIVGWILCTGRHTLTRVLQFAAGGLARKHPSVLYRFFGRAVWALGPQKPLLVLMVLRVIPGRDVTALVDDTLCRKTGPHLWGAGMHHDALASTYGRAGRPRVVSFAFGLSWVIVSLWVPLPWNPARGLAVPVMVRLYRAKKRCPPADYRKRTELAAEMLGTLAAQLPPERRLLAVGDSEYACRTVVRRLSPSVVFVGPMPMNAAVYAEPLPRKGRGRPAKKGPRLPSPGQLAADPRVLWERRTVVLYGRPVDVLFKTQMGLWASVAGERRLRMIVTRDPKGRIEDRAYFSTDPALSVDDIAQTFARRWSQEVLHRNVKQHLGIEDPQNGFWRRRATDADPGKLAGPNPHEHRGLQAATRTVPLALLTYALVLLWYLGHGRPHDDVARARLRAPWNRRKTEPAFSDMLQALRREIWAARFPKDPLATPLHEKSAHALVELLMAA